MSAGSGLSSPTRHAAAAERACRRPAAYEYLLMYLLRCLFVTLFGVTCYTLHFSVTLVTLGDVAFAAGPRSDPLGGFTRINRTQRVLNLGIITSIYIHNYTVRACSRSHHTRSRGRRRERWGRARASRSERTSAQVHPFDVLAPCWHSPPCRRSSHLHASTREG